MGKTSYWFWFGFLLFWVTSLPGFCQNLVVNGGFETGNFSSWTQFGSTGFSSVVSSGDSSISAPEGSRYAKMGPTSSGGIFQNLTTIVGAVYQISYTLHAGLSTSRTRSFSAQFGAVGGLTSLEALTNPALFGFSTRSFTFVATSTTSQIRFTFENDPDYWRLDNVSVTNKAPELSVQGAATPLLAACMLILIGLERRRR